MPSQKDILEYWNEYFKNDDRFYILNKICCFACGRKTKIERAHILPRFEGGKDEIENIHLLCTGCHTDSENIWGKAYWNWLYWTNKNEYKDFLERYYDFLKKCGIDYEPDKELLKEIEIIQKAKSRKLTNKEIKDIGDKHMDKIKYLKEGGLK